MKTIFSKKSLFFYSLFFLVFLFQQTFANDSSFMGQGAIVYPVKETRIKMLSEDITLHLEENWYVTAKYKFQNPTDKKVSLQVGFPEYKCFGDCPQGSWTFFNLQTKVRDQVVKQRIGQAQANKNYVDAGRVYLFDVVFEPNETLEVLHTYNYQTSSSVEGQDLFYITKTGALWNGPIGHAKFTVIMPQRPYRLAFDPSYKMVSFYEDINSKTQKPQTYILFEMKNWTPTEDFYLGYNSTTQRPELRFDCPGENAFYDYDYKTKKDNLISPEKRKSILSKIKDIDLCRNLVFAKHGYNFKNQKWQKLFYESPKIITTGNPHWESSDHPKKQNYMRIGMQMNPKYTSNLLSSKEKQYIQWLMQEKARREK